MPDVPLRGGTGNEVVLSDAGGSLTVAAGFASAAATAYAPSVLATTRIAAGFAAAVATAYAPTVSAPTTVAAGSASGAATAYTPTGQPGIYTAAIDLTLSGSLTVDLTLSGSAAVAVAWSGGFAVDLVESGNSFDLNLDNSGGYQVALRLRP